MTYRPEDEKGSFGENLNAFYRRKQSFKHNQLKGEAEVLHDADTDCDARDNFSYGSKGYARPENKSLGGTKPKEHDIWSDEAWDKEKP